MPASDLFFFELADGMTIPAGGEHSALDCLVSFLDEVRVLPHVGELKEIAVLRTLLKEQKKEKLWPAQEALCLPSARVAAKWKKAKVRLLFEPSSVLKELKSAFVDVRKSFPQLQVYPKHPVAEQLGKVIKDLSSEGGAYKELKSAESQFNQLFSRFLDEKRSKSDTSEDVMSVDTWLGNRLGMDAGSIRQELETSQELVETEGSSLEALLLYVATLEKRQCTSDGRVSSDADSEVPGSNKSLAEVAQDAVLALRSPQMHRVLMGIRDLIACIKNGKLEVFQAGAIPEAIRLAEVENGPYLSDAMALLKALSSACDAGKEVVRVDIDICLDIGDHLNFLINLMKDRKHPEARLLAAETVVNVLVISEIRQTVRTQRDFVSALVAISIEETWNTSIHGLNRRDHVCLVGLRRLTDLSKRTSLEEKPGGETIVTALMQLLSVGLEDTDLKDLAKDTLVALDSQVLLMDHRTPSREVCLQVRSHLLSLMDTHEFISHPTVLGRMAIISLMTKLCSSYVGGAISVPLFLYLLKVIQTTRSELREPLDDQRRSDLKKLLQLSVKLLCFCVKHDKDTAQAVLTKNVDEWKFLEGILEEEHLGDFDDTKLEILEIFDHIDTHNSSQGPTSVGEVAVLVKMAKSLSPACRVKVASRFRKFVVGNLDENEMRKAGGVNALMDLLRDEIVECQVDALLALYHLSQSIEIQTKELPLQIILAFLQLERGDIREAAAWFLDLLVKENTAASAKKFMATPEALTAMLHCFGTDAENPVNQTCASALLSMATEEDAGDVRVGVANAELSVLVKFVRDHAAVEHMEMLTTMLALLCRNATDFGEALIYADGHKFMLESLQNNIAKRAAAEGLLSLIRDARTQGDVLRAEFVEMAMGSVDQESSTEVALALANICVIPVGLEKIVACPRSVGVLLQLLEVCPTTEGKAAAAAVITALYTRLGSNADSTLQVEMTAACSCLIPYIAQEDKSHVEVFLNTLAVFATGSKGRERILEEHGEEPLMHFLRSTSDASDAEVRDLVWEILAKMSNVFPEGISRGEPIHPKFLNMFLKNKIGELLCPPHADVGFWKPQRLKNVLILIKNLSVAGPGACVHLSENGVIQLLLNVLRDNVSSPLPETELAVKALLKLVDDPIEKKAFLRSGEGIKLLVAVLKLEPKSSDAILILTSVAEDLKTAKDVCTAMFNCDILPALTSIIDRSEAPKRKWQAATLAKLLVTHGPTQKVCDAMCTAGTVEAVLRLRSVRHCDKVADDIIKILERQKGDLKKRCDARLRSSR